MLGKRIPQVTFKTRVRDDSLGGDNPFKWKDVPSQDIFSLGKRVVAFSLPGAFTPTCSNEQCPAFERLHDEFKEAGVDDVYCIAVNDAFVMYQWSLKLGAKKTKFLPDGSGTFTRLMGMLVNKDALGFGYRSWRYAMVVDDGKVIQWFEEPGINDCGNDDDPYGASAPENVLSWVKENPKPPSAV
jgi:peroxiredoxin